MDVDGNLYDALSGVFRGTRLVAGVDCWPHKEMGAPSRITLVSICVVSADVCQAFLGMLVLVVQCSREVFQGRGIGL